MVNVPVALQEGRQGASCRDVIFDPMLFIFVVDALMAVANFAVAAMCLT